MSKLIAIITSLFFAGTVFAGSYSNHEVDYEALIKLFMQDKGDDSTMLDWSTGAEKTSPIIWQHAGVVECDEETVKNRGTPKEFSYG